MKCALNVTISRSPPSSSLSNLWSFPCTKSSGLLCVSTLCHSVYKYVLVSATGSSTETSITPTKDHQHLPTVAEFREPWCEPWRVAAEGSHQTTAERSAASTGGVLLVLLWRTTSTEVCTQHSFKIIIEINRAFELKDDVGWENNCVKYQRNPLTGTDTSTHPKYSDKFKAGHGS